ncbi:glycosyltransferase family 2 protein [Methylocystis parvus]|uniref:Glycosyltransferase family 2 protein n=1 Tax=Methylocystis parvus TaxID=134 RepID=A0A6B8M2L0_9HYPH|nr:glycosyltransferase family 2 protein [Methylocystis parvus]QGM96482.1 glycosyltransferase family 2 protein [Methylocystis parvus]WBJ99667.1 glycosyltransferase family 2 protein [Methylocystis parvus OBBP]
MKIVVAIATTGRPEIVGACLERFSRLTRQPDRLLAIGAAPEDAPKALRGAEFYLARARGLPIQRNLALDLVASDAEIVVFIDDDYVPAPGFVEGIERLFAENPDVVAASGVLIADGVNRKGLSFDQADKLVSAYALNQPLMLADATGAYGCNMAFRLSAAPHLRFDENLPLYAWLEDTDFSAQYARIGRVVRTNHFTGVHLGVTSGRTSGLRLGYSQIANPLYLVRKGTVAPRFALNLALRNMIANLVKSPRPEPNVDRFGRLRGNLIALVDMLRGRSHPLRALDL